MAGAGTSRALSRSARGTGITPGLAGDAVGVSGGKASTLDNRARPAIAAPATARIRNDCLPDDRGTTPLVCANAQAKWLDRHLRQKKPGGQAPARLEFNPGQKSTMTVGLKVQVFASNATVFVCFFLATVTVAVTV